VAFSAAWTSSSQRRCWPVNPEGGGRLYGTVSQEGRHIGGDLGIDPPESYLDVGAALKTGRRTTGAHR
jgi:hypothetical protein